MDLEDRYNKIKKEFDKMVGGFEDEISIDHKVLKEGLKSQIDLQVKWERIYAKIYALNEAAKDETEVDFAVAYKESMSDSYKSLSSTDGKYYATCDPKYIDSKKFSNKVLRLKKEAEAYVDIVETRKYILKDITASMINSVDTLMI